MRQLGCKEVAYQSLGNRHIAIEFADIVAPDIFLVERHERRSEHHFSQCLGVRDQPKRVSGVRHGKGFDHVGDGVPGVDRSVLYAEVDGNLFSVSLHVPMIPVSG